MDQSGKERSLHQHRQLGRPGRNDVENVQVDDLVRHDEGYMVEEALDHHRPAGMCLGHLGHA